MIKYLLRLLSSPHVYIYLLKYDQNYYGLCGCELILKKINVNNLRYYFTDNYLDQMTMITEEQYNNLKLKSNSSSMEFL